MPSICCLNASTAAGSSRPHSIGSAICCYSKVAGVTCVGCCPLVYFTGLLLLGCCGLYCSALRVWPGVAGTCCERAGAAQLRIAMLRMFLGTFTLAREKVSQPVPFFNGHWCQLLEVRYG